MKRLFCIYILSSSLLLSATTYAQVQDYASDDEIEQARSNDPLNEGDYPKSVETLNEDTDLTADPYFSSDWIEGQVELDGGTEYQNVSLRYDIHNNQLLVKQDGRPAPLEQENVRSFTLGPPRLSNLARFERAEYLGIDKVPDDQFVQVLHEGETKLLAVHHKDAVTAGGEEAFSDTQTDYYYVSPRGKVSSFEPNRASIVKLFSDKEEAVDEYITEATIDFDSAADLARIVIFYERHEEP